MLVIQRQFANQLLRTAISPFQLPLLLGVTDLHICFSAIEGLFCDSMLSTNLQNRSPIFMGSENADDLSLQFFIISLDLIPKRQKNNIENGIVFGGQSVKEIGEEEI